MIHRTFAPPRRFATGILLLTCLLLAACGADATPTAVVPTSPAATPTTAPAATLPAATATAAPAAATATTASAEATATTALPAATATTAPVEATATSAPSGDSAGASTPTAPVPTAQASTCNGTLTPALTEGPYYKAGSPERASLLAPGMAGTKLVVTGAVYDANCRPVAGAWLDFWQADSAGNYDNAGYTLRGHQFTDATGHYRLETVVPGEYPGRTVHIHVKVRAPNGPTLTTQLFLPNVARNSSDSIFSPALVMQVQDSADGKTATFDFVVDTGST